MSENTNEVEELPPCITPEELAQQLQVCRDHVYRMWRGGWLRGVKVGRRIIIPRSELDRIVTEMEAKEVKDLRTFRTG